MRDLHNNIKVVSLMNDLLASGGAKVSSIVDRKGYESLELIIQVGPSGATGGWTVEVQESDANTASTLTAVADAHLTNLESTVAFAQGSPGVAKIGYIGTKRYVAVSLTSDTATGRQSVIAILGNPSRVPTS